MNVREWRGKAPNALLHEQQVFSQSCIHKEIYNNQPYKVVGLSKQAECILNLHFCSRLFFLLVFCGMLYLLLVFF